MMPEKEPTETVASDHSKDSRAPESGRLDEGRGARDQCVENRSEREGAPTPPHSGEKEQTPGQAPWSDTVSV